MGRVLALRRKSDGASICAVPYAFKTDAGCYCLAVGVGIRGSKSMCGVKNDEVANGESSSRRSSDGGYAARC